MKTIDLYQEKELCCGCSLCANVCPAQTIQMKPDKSGFFYPVVINEEACLGCQRCIKVCPIKNVGREKSEFIDYYAASYISDAETISCSSGGLATGIARAFIKNGGVVYGAAYTKDYKGVKYIRVSDENMLNLLKGSKYSQAEKDMIYKRISDDLSMGIKCLFIGLPCDVAAVSNYFKKSLGLYTIELVCHGPTSTEVQKQYCESLERKHSSRITFFTNRYKKDGNWKPFYNYVEFDNSSSFMEQFHESSFGSAFRYLKRPSCYVCQIKDEALCGDLMIGDYHYVESGMKGYNSHGVSSAMVHNAKGQELLESLDDAMNVVRIPRRNALANGAIHHPIDKPRGALKYRDIFLKEGLEAAHRKWFVTKSNIQRRSKSALMNYAVKMKRIICPRSRPNG